MQRVTQFIIYCMLGMTVHSHAADLDVKIPKQRFDLNNMSKINEGAAFFKERCFTCHSMKYLEYDQISIDAGIKPELAVVWPEDSWQGNPPPDLSLVAVTRGTDWLYGYLKGYYYEKEGYNNLIWPNTSMPNPYADLQGKQKLVMTMPQIKTFHPRFYQALKLEEAGSISAHDFNKKIDALMHYLVYASDPSVVERHALGPMVIIFMLTLAIFAYLLYRDYKRDFD